MRFFALLTTVLFSISSYSHASVKLVDVGVLGLASHDLFQWNSSTHSNDENGRLDLSTIFDYQNGELVRSGGNPKNSGNAPVFTVTQTLVNFYYGKKTSLLMSGHFDDEAAHTLARKETIHFFIGMLRETYRRMTGDQLPSTALLGHVSNEEQAAMRALHDILPENIIVQRGFNSQEFSVTNFTTVFTFLSASELSQRIDFYDGHYDPAYLAIMVPGNTGPQFVNLQEQDRIFIEGQTNYELQNMLEELADYSQQKYKNLVEFTSFGHHLKTLFSKGLCHTNEDGTENMWIDLQINCE